MLKKESRLLILSVFLMIIVSSFISAIACSDTNEIDNSEIPCVGLTNYLTCSGNISVINLNTSEQFNLTTDAFGDGRLNFTVNLSEGSYSFTDCGNNTATVIIGVFDTQWQIALIISLLVILSVYIYCAYFIFSSDMWAIKTLFYCFSLLILILAVNMAIIISDINNVDNIVETGLTITIVVFWFFLSYVFVVYTIDILKKFKNFKKGK